ncbi:endolytic transglycosylase MltG [Parenemella sanctibonifatiensis]|uniref:Endolytic murein transglycosylase n=1 Tax=Parenemella sanctibonifatiensis TaxID=2016505 RepID=A0A255E4U5_9ACTN|nr:endolytic transglycosylase MltG [Parenemella sanctibonifatiensis]OYN86526.1 aminodeoxychorismate lyase [Parenemella sanctibonifatiensis]OYN91038.1 aminodeoxychorismate lyase [Parenemella sanctibonifatiensis]
MSRNMLDPEEDSRAELVRRLKSAFAVLLSLAIIAGGGYFVYTKASDLWYSLQTREDYIGEGTEPVEVQIPRGATLSQMGRLLTQADVVRSTDAFLEAARANEEASSIQPGTYTLKKQLPAAKAVEMLLDPDNRVVPTFRIREGLWLEEQIRQLSEQTGVPEDAFRQAMEDPGSFGLSAWAEGNPEGFLFPDSYQYEGDTPQDVLRPMTAQFDAVAADLRFLEKADELGVSPRDAMIVASLIEAEVRRPEDRPMVARVIYNRLAQGQRLEFDTTVKYIFRERQGADTTANQRESDDPYNTYRYEGLPPGPINSPGRTAMEAAVNPADGAWLYFVAVNLDTGETRFAETYEEHLANVEVYRQWCRDNPGKCS